MKRQGAPGSRLADDTAGGEVAGHKERPEGPQGREVEAHWSDAHILIIGVFIAFVETIGILPAGLGQLGHDDKRKRADNANCGHRLNDLDRAHAALSGRGLPMDFATNRKCAIREDGMPFVRQLWTVETGASVSLATAEVPPK